MYHLLIADDPHVISRGTLAIDKFRYLECTYLDIRNQYEYPNESQLQELKQIPFLLLTDAFTRPVVIGYLQEITEKGRTFTLTFNLETLESVSRETIKREAEALDIRPWEMDRTHWAIKKADLREILQ